jgi:hypothetical protein
VVVYQTISNFGNAANPFLEDFLRDLLDRKIVDELVFYQPRLFSVAEKRHLLSAKARSVLHRLFLLLFDILMSK